MVIHKAGHGDEIAIVDCNFPAESTALKTESGNLVKLAAVDVVEGVDAICSVMPVDAFVDCACFYMAPNAGDELPDLAKEVHAAGISTIKVRISMKFLREVHSLQTPKRSFTLNFRIHYFFLV